MPQKIIVQLLAYLLLACATTSSLASSDRLDLDAPKGSAELQPFVTYYLDKDWQRTIPEMLGEYADQFKPVETENPDFGYQRAKIWLRIDVVNVSDAETDWRLYFKENFKQLFDVFVVREDQSVETVLSQDLERGFSSRSIQFPELVAPISIAPGEKVTLIVRYWSEGASYLSLNIETASSFALIAAKRTAKNFVYYGMMFLLIIAALISVVIFRHVVFLAYVAYAISSLLFIMHSDGVAYQYLWPDFPNFNSNASIVTGLAIIISACNYARVFLLTKERHPIMNTLLLLVIFLSVMVGLSAFFVDKQLVKKSLVAMSLVAITICTVSGIVAGRTRFKEVRFFLFAWFGILAAAGLMNLRHWLGVEVSQDFQYDFMRFVMVLDAAMMGLAIGDRYFQLRSARQNALKDSLAAAERNLELSKRLNLLENQFLEAEKRVESKDREIEDTIHDLKQPLHALRLRVSDLMEKGRQANGNVDVEETFTYLERLISSHLNSTDDNTAAMIEQDADHETLGDISTNEILQSVHQMFLPDAKERGLEFDFVPTSLKADIPSLPLMRLVTNLVSNAIKYTESGKVLLGCRRTKDGMTIEVHDTGPGLSQEVFNYVTTRKVRLHGAEAMDGQGYGLSIVSDVLRDYDLGISLCDRRRTGSGIKIEINTV